MKILLTVPLICLICSSGMAQDHMMHMNHSGAPKERNVFLLMMDTMMVQMANVPAERTAEKVFLSQMIPHHFGAVAMSRYEIAHGKNFDMIQLAKSILAEQQSEIVTMNIWLKRSANGQQRAGGNFTEAMDKAMAAMMQQLPESDQLNNIDLAFARVMLPHHQAAIDMAGAVLHDGKDPQVLAFAKVLISNEEIEIQQMSTYIK